MSRCRECPSGQEVCRRCARRLCVEHTPFGGHACADCELVYFESRDNLLLKVWFLVGFALPWLVLAMLHGSLPSESARATGFRGMSTGVPLVDISIMTMVGAVLLGTAARGFRVWLHRRAFLAPARS